MKTLVSTLGSFFLITFIVGCGDNNTNPADPSSGSAANGGNSSTGSASSSQGGSSDSTATVGGTGTSSGGGNATTGGTGSASSAGSGSGSATSCVALASACQSVNDCCVTGYPLVCNITCQPALIANGGSTSTGGNGSTSTGNSGSIVCHTNGDSCFADQQCCSKKCDFSASSPVCINGVVTNPSGTGGNGATGGSSANATGGKSTTGGNAATGGATGPIACMPTNMSCSTSSAAACCSGVCSNSVCQ